MMLYMDDAVLDCVLLTIRVAGVATLMIVVIGTAVGWALARGKVPAQLLVEAVLLLPMTMPPVAVGLVLLNLMAPSGPLGTFWYLLTGERLLLTWQAAAMAAFTVALPLYVRAAQEAFAAVPRRLEGVAESLGLGPWRLWFQVSLPLAGPGLAAGGLLAFARALGEFGATSLVAGAIAGRTETLAVAIYNSINNGNEHQAWVLALWSAALAVLATVASRYLSTRFPSVERRG
jgi:molybdate transport system permease protein